MRSIRTDQGRRDDLAQREWHALNRWEKRRFNKNVQIKLTVIMFLVGAITALLLMRGH